MKRSLSHFGVVLFATLLSAANLWAQCGVERWSVKTGTDADVSKVNLGSSSAITIATMRAWAKPASLPANNRISPNETTQWVLNATLTEYKLESDSDYHLVIQDGSGNSMIAEIPSPNCVGSGSRFGSGISNSRNEFDAKFTATSSFKTTSTPVQIRGVGMFDFLHGQTGVAPNGIEIHPVLDIIFNPGTNPDFSISDSPTSIAVTQGTSGNSSISTSVSGGFNSAISLSATGLPSGATASFSPGSIAAPGGGSTLTITTAGTTPAGSYTVTVTGSGGGTMHTTSLLLTVTAASSPDFVIGESPTSVGVVQGSSGTSTTTTSVSGGFNSTVSLSASGLPSGASATFSPTSIAAPGSGSSTLTISTSASTPTGTSTVTITGTGGGKTHTTSLSLTVSSAGGGSQLLSNPGFESGATVWTATSGVITNSSSEAAHGGTWKAWLDGYGTATTDTLMQTVSIPSTATTATLTFWLHIDTAETTTTTMYDTLKVQIRNSSGTVVATLATYSNLNAASGYSQKSFNLNAYVGQTIQVYLVGTEDSLDQTSFVVDDFALNVN